MAWEENPRICLHMQLIAILSRTGVYNCSCFCVKMSVGIPIGKIINFFVSILNLLIKLPPLK